MAAKVGVRASLLKAYTSVVALPVIEPQYSINTQPIFMYTTYYSRILEYKTVEACVHVSAKVRGWRSERGEGGIYICGGGGVYTSVVVVGGGGGGGGQRVYVCGEGGATCICLW